MRMSIPEVYFRKIGRGAEECFSSLLKETKKLLSCYKSGSIVGIKMTVGDEGSTGYIKPELVRLLVDALKERGVKPFVFDTNVIYRGSRQNAVDHLNLAYRKGFTPERLGCPYIIADSVFGNDSRRIKVNFKNLKELRIPSYVKAADDLIVLTHITGHIMAGYAASIKNVAMGMASRAGKQAQHSSIKPVIDTDNCNLCGCCLETCPVSAITEMNGSAFINTGQCIGCGECIACCMLEAVTISWESDEQMFAERMTEYAHGILARISRKTFINFAMDITEECDCIAGDDRRIFPDLGIFISDDILAVDKACYDMLNDKRDVFSRRDRINTHVQQFEYASEIGLGSLDYELVKIP
ncbi:MAG: DUF362 domain-containing protein [Nitrospira sp.]|nr:DUF362 domain-containing protein [bacterium]MBL7047903.1 DUF362 domain-containing protein [Nitrospira sp.]